MVKVHVGAIAFHLIVYVYQEKMDRRMEEMQYTMEQQLKKLEEMILGEAQRLTEMQQVIVPNIPT